jgi:cyclic pyranopterin phosphate synthase
MKDGLTHIDERGRARMVDVSGKEPSVRRARAEARVRIGAELAALILETGSVAKGNVLETARLAGIMGAKKVPQLVPLAHPIVLDFIDVEARLEHDCVVLTSTVGCTGRTGVEVEAMAAASLAALTVYDMCKSMGKGIVIESVRLMEKSGGKSGTYTREGTSEHE